MLLNAIIQQVHSNLQMVSLCKAFVHLHLFTQHHYQPNSKRQLIQVPIACVHNCISITSLLASHYRQAK